MLYKYGQISFASSQCNSTFPAAKNTLDPHSVHLIETKIELLTGTIAHRDFGLGQLNPFCIKTLKYGSMFADYEYDDNWISS